jgi:hypothetical protein
MRSLVISAELLFRSDHSMDTNLTCVLCKYKFTTKSSLRRHHTKKKRPCTKDTFYPPPGWSLLDDTWNTLPMQKRNITPEELRKRKNARNKRYYWCTRRVLYFMWRHANTFGIRRRQRGIEVKGSAKHQLAKHSHSYKNSVHRQKSRQM